MVALYLKLTDVFLGTEGETGEKERKNERKNNTTISLSILFAV